MKLTLIPPEERFLDLFVEAAANVLGAARLLDAMLRSYDDLDRRVEEIVDAERRGNDIEREIRTRVDAAFVPPFDRSDVRGLSRTLDGVLDAIEEAADAFVRYAIESPSAAAVEAAAIVVRQCEQLHAALGRLPSSDRVDDNIAEVRRLAVEATRIHRAAVAALFDGGDALEVIRWQRVHGTLAAAVERAGDTADVIERIAVRNA